MTTGVGPTIIRGPRGEAGSQIYIDVESPSAELGDNGDLYIDSTTNNYYQKVDDIWVFKGTFGTGGGGGFYAEIDSMTAETTVTHNFNRFPIVDVLEITFLSGSDAFTFDAFTRDAFDTEEERIRKPDDEYILKHPDRNTIVLDQGLPRQIKIILTA